MILNGLLISVLIMLYALLIVTELYVLKKEMRYVGIVIPVVSFIFSIMFCEKLALVIAITRARYLFGYILFNIPMIILVGLYFMKRKKASMRTHV